MSERGHRRSLTLQWGRTLSSAERLGRKKWSEGICGSLQWGRTLSSAESPRECICPARRQTCFNGAALFQVRKGIDAHYRHRHEDMASMGPHSFKCGKQIPHTLGTSRIEGFNGAALFQVRKAPFYPTKYQLPNSASMGPHSFKCGKVILSP